MAAADVYRDTLGGSTRFVSLDRSSSGFGFVRLGPSLKKQ